MFNKKILITTLAFLMSGSVFAESNGLSYSHVGLGYQAAKLDSYGFGGFGISGSKALNDSIYLVGAYSYLSSWEKVDFGFGADNLNATVLNIGAGYHTPVNKNTDFFTDLILTNVEGKHLQDVVHANGYIINTGFRGMVTEIIELGASIYYDQIENDGEFGCSFSASAMVSAAPKISFGIVYDPFNAVSFGVKFAL